MQLNMILVMLSLVLQNIMSVPVDRAIYPIDYWECCWFQILIMFRLLTGLFGRKAVFLAKSPFFFNKKKLAKRLVKGVAWPFPCMKYILIEFTTASIDAKWCISHILSLTPLFFLLFPFIFCLFCLLFSCFSMFIDVNIKSSLPHSYFFCARANCLLKRARGARDKYKVCLLIGGEYFLYFVQL